MKTKKVKGVFETGTGRFHRFAIKSDGIPGTLYIPRGESVPDLVEVKLHTKTESEARE
jgi:hypothetical protein